MENKNKKQAKNSRLCLFAIALILLSCCSPAVAGSFLPVMNTDTLDYYTGYGEPELSASLRGNQEFGKGESANLQITIANKGMLERLAYREYISGVYLETNNSYYEKIGSTGMSATDFQYNGEVILPDAFRNYLRDTRNLNAQQALANVEMQLEAGRVNAQSLNIKFDCDSQYVEVEDGGDYTFWDSLASGYYNVAFVPIKVSPNAPAGKYILNATIEYQYPSNAKMITTGSGLDGLTTAFVYSDTYIQEYETAVEVIQIPFYISSGPVFDVTAIDGTLQSGKTRTVAVTYTNVGDETAYNAESKIDMMYPLSSSRNKGLLGDVAPGESVTIEYPIKSHSSSIGKIYAVNSDVRYYNENNDLKIAPSIKINMEMLDPSTIFTLKNALIGTLILIIISLGYDFYKTKKKKQGQKK